MAVVHCIQRDVQSSLLLTKKFTFYVCVCVIVSEFVTVHAHAYSLPLRAPSRTNMNQRYKLALWKTSYESSCRYFSPTEPEDNSGWWNTLQSEHQAHCSHSQWGRYYRTHNYSQPLNLPCRQLDWGLACYILKDFSHSVQRNVIGGLLVATKQGKQSMLFT